MRRVLMSAVAGGIGCLLVYFSWGNQAITTIDSYAKVNFVVIPDDALVIFDVDETLIQPQDRYVMHEHSQQAKKLQQELMRDYEGSGIDWVYLQSLVVEQAKRPLIEPLVIPAIDALKARGIPVIACTYMNTGPLGVIDLLERWRYDQLQAVGFVGSYQDRVFAIPFPRGHPVFYRGIIASDLQEKGPVLGAWLDSMDFHPSVIIVFEDTMANLVSVQGECVKRGIAFQGYYYTGAHKKPWHEELARVQARYLIEHHQWLSDEQAYALLAQHKEVSALA